ncbi:MAG: hypothetical protein KA152_14405 [Verrucomicrobiales bacterium]|nr:hypothetical protein [Verrucomicrobiales bacterium]HQW29432.1 hypothetical protein [Verrucomicrobiales bacterium]
MVRKATQLLILPLLFALLAAGGNATLCQVLSLVGIEAHHHVVCEDDGPVHPGPVCAETHDDHSEEHEKAPCPESCGIQLTDATAPILVKRPAISETIFLPFLLDVALAVDLPTTCLGAGEMLEPPDHGASLADPTFTGRFLV